MFKVSKTALQAALSAVKDAVNSRNTIPILANIAVERHGEGLRLRATNLDIEISAAFEAEIGDDFSAFTFPAKTVTSIVGNLDDGKPVSFEPAMSGNQLSEVTIKSGCARIKVPVLPISDFPLLDKEPLPFTISLGTSALTRCLSAVSFAMANEEARAYLCGIFLHPRESGLMFVATDGHRLSRRLLPVIEIDDPLDKKMPAVILSREVVPLLIKHLPKDETVSISLSDYRIRFEAGQKVITSKLVEGTYPDYERLSPKEHKIRASVRGPELAAAVSRVMTVNTEKGNAVRFAFAEEEVTLTTRPGDAGQAEDSVAATSTGPIEIGMNGGYLREIIDNTDGDELEIDFIDAASPILVRKPGETDTHCILMPMRV